MLMASRIDTKTMSLAFMTDWSFWSSLPVQWLLRKQALHKSRVSDKAVEHQEHAAFVEVRRQATQPQ